jgi:hypothetical protein
VLARRDRVDEIAQPVGELPEIDRGLDIHLGEIAAAGALHEHDPVALGRRDRCVGEPPSPIEISSSVSLSSSQNTLSGSSLSPISSSRYGLIGLTFTELALDAGNLGLEVVDHVQARVDRSAPRLRDLEAVEQLAADGAE